VHMQSAVSFWQRAYVVSSDDTQAQWHLPRWRTGDRELGALWSATLGGDIRCAFGAEYVALQQALLLRVALVRTEFLDALYIRERYGVLIGLSVDGAFH
jgi:hypothetical protein